METGQKKDQEKQDAKHIRKKEEKTERKTLVPTKNGLPHERGRKSNAN